jgi:hypothetical protein
VVLTVHLGLRFGGVVLVKVSAIKGFYDATLSLIVFPSLGSERIVSWVDNKELDVVVV